VEIEVEVEKTGDSGDGGVAGDGGGGGLAGSWWRLYYKIRESSVYSFLISNL